MQRGVFENSHHAMKSDYTKAWKHCQVEEELSSKAHGEDPVQWDGNRLSKPKRAKGHDNAT